jgi:hypothetical protein
LWDKWYHLFDNIDTEPEALPRVRTLVGRLLRLQRGGDPLDRQQPLRRQQAVGGEARLGPGRYFDLKAIKQPIIVFASMGDNITPPQQAFNWIADVYSRPRKSRPTGQTIVGLLHKDIGHLGIFVPARSPKKNTRRSSRC